MSNPSLILPQSPAYGEDYVYAAQVEDGAVPLYNVLPLTFTRASGGTRINKDGLVQNMPYNLCEYSEELNIWSTERASVTTNATTAPNGTTTADKVITDSTANNTHQIYIGPFTTPNLPFVISAYAKKSEYDYIHLGASGSSTKTWFDLNNGTVGTQSSDVLSASIESIGNGWYRCINIINNTSTSNYVELGPANVDGSRIISGTPSGGIFAWGAQLNIGSTAQPYLATTDRLNMPRITYPVGGGCGALLLEKQSTNLVTYSEQFDNAAWSLSDLTITANNAISPDGTQNADLISSTSSVGLAYQVKTLSGLHTISAFFKAGTSVLPRLQFYDSGAGTSGIGSYNLSTQSVSTSGLSSTGTITSCGNGWYRCTLTANLSGSSINCFIGVDENAKNLLAWGAQVEASSYPTSYISTTSASATRVADACYKTGISSLFGTNQGTFFIDLLYLNSDNPDYLFDVTDSSNTQRFLMYDYNGSGLFIFYDSYYGTITTMQLTKGQRYKIGVKYNASGTIWYVNGILKATGTGNFAYQMSQIYLGQRFSIEDQSQIQVNGTQLFTTALTNAQLATLTTL